MRVCDRCKKELKEPNNIEIYKSLNFHNRDTHINKYEFCDNCTDDLSQVLNEFVKSSKIKIVPERGLNG